MLSIIKNIGPSCPRRILTLPSPRLCGEGREARRSGWGTLNTNPGFLKLLIVIASRSIRLVVVVMVLATMVAPYCRQSLHRLLLSHFCVCFGQIVSSKALKKATTSIYFCHIFGFCKTMRKIYKGSEGGYGRVPLYYCHIFGYHYHKDLQRFGEKIFVYFLFHFCHFFG